MARYKVTRLLHVSNHKGFVTTFQPGTEVEGWITKHGDIMIRGTAKNGKEYTMTVDPHWVEPITKGGEQ